MEYELHATYLDILNFISHILIFSSHLVVPASMSMHLHIDIDIDMSGNFPYETFVVTWGKSHNIRCEFWYILAAKQVGFRYIV